MKKLVVLTVMFCFLAGAVFAQSYTVQSVTGRVQREAGATRIDVRAGETIAADVIIHTGVGASLVLNQGTNVFTIPAVRSGTVEELVISSAGARISGNVARVETGTIVRTTGQVSTASARASDAAADDDIAAE